MNQSDFSVTPRVVLEGSRVTVVITPESGETVFSKKNTYEITHRPLEDYGSFSTFNETRKLEFEIRDGALKTELTLEGEQEHSLLVEMISGSERSKVGDFRLYSIAEDLYKKRPRKGELHIHSNRSDGMEEPGYVAAACRRAGFDFMALTDHALYAPSIVAQQAFSGVQIDMSIFPGEEVHPPGNHIHIVNFGGSESVSTMIEEFSFNVEVEQMMKDLPSLPTNVDPYMYASSLWCFKKIHDVGGLSIFCHPYWVDESRYYIPGALTSILFEQQPYDAYELIGGYHLNEVESNVLQVLRYQEERAKGKSIPVVGVSDAHGCERGELFGWYYTIVFSETTEFEDLVSSIKNLYSVAVEALPDSPVRCHGPLRLCKYSYFLLREVFHGHDVLCAEEGELMMRHFHGDTKAADTLKRMRGRGEAYWERCFA